MLTPEQRGESRTDAKIEAREQEIVAAQGGAMDDQVDDLELLGLYELRWKFLKRLQKRESR